MMSLRSELTRRAREAAAGMGVGVILRGRKPPKDILSARLDSARGAESPITNAWAILAIASDLPQATREDARASSRHCGPGAVRKILRALMRPQDDRPQEQPRRFAGRPAPRRPSAAARGSTLIELIVVLAIIGLVFGLAIPAMTALPVRASVSSPADTLRLVAATEGRLVRGDSAVALPDGRLIARRGSDAE